MYTNGDQWTIGMAAARIRAMMARANGGRLPRSERAWRRLLAQHGIEIWECRRHTRHFRGRLYIEPWGATVFLAPWLTPYQTMRILCHELAEYLAVQLCPIPSDDACSEYHYDGGARPQDYRHLVAKEVERMTFPRLPLFWALRD
jgi:hypothetical protein